MNLRQKMTIGMLAATLGLAGAASLHTSKAQADPLGMVAGEVLDVSAEHLDVDVSSGTARLTGDVHAKLGELEVNCDSVEIRYDESPRIKWARGTGSVVAKLKGIEARARSVEVDVAHRSVRLEGGVRLARGKGWVTAERATIDIATRKVSLESVKGSIPVQAPRR